MHILTQELSTFIKFEPLKNTPVGMLTLEELDAAHTDAGDNAGACDAMTAPPQSNTTKDAASSFFISNTMIGALQSYRPVLRNRSVDCITIPPNDGPEKTLYARYETAAHAIA